MTGSIDWSSIFNKNLDKFIDFGEDLVVAIVILVVGFRLANWVVKIARKTMEQRNIEFAAVSFTCSFLRIALKAVILFMAVERIGVKSSSIIALIGSAGIAVGLALQGSLTNVAGGVLLLLLKPFQVGDYIVIDGTNCEGTVVALDIFYTKLETVDNRVIVIPNGTMTNSNLTNNTKQEKRLIDLAVHVSYECDLQQAKDILNQILIKEKRLIHPEENHVFVSDLADSSVVLGVRAWVLTQDYLKTKWDLLETIKLRFDEEGIEIPYQKIDITFNKKEMETN